MSAPSIVVGAEALMREAGYAAEKASKHLAAADLCNEEKHADEAASNALRSIAHSFRELCCLGRVALSIGQSLAKAHLAKQEGK